MNLAPELKWLTLASEASSRQAGLQRCGPRKSRHLPNHDDGPSAPRDAEGGLRKRSRFPQVGSAIGGSRAGGQGSVRTDTLGGENVVRMVDGMCEALALARSLRKRPVRLVVAPAPYAWCPRLGGFVRR